MLLISVVNWLVSITANLIEPYAKPSIQIVETKTALIERGISEKNIFERKGDEKL